MEKEFNLLLLFIMCHVVLINNITHGTDSKTELKVDKKGYIIFCLCMGRFGNQADHFLGGLKFAKSIDRTLILPPWRTYKNLEFTEWFQLKPLLEYHRVITAEDFMENLAPTVWPSGNRIGFCYSRAEGSCDMKNGNPFGPFWDGLGVDFDSILKYTISYSNPQKWIDEFPPDKYPVIALRGAPARFPIEEPNIPLQKYLKWSDKIEEEAQSYIDRNFRGEKFVGLHLRNGGDWEKACKNAVDMFSFMASPQCLGYNNKKNITSDLCLPSEEEVLRLTKKVVLELEATVVFVATDKYPMKEAIEDHLKDQKVKVFHMDPWLPQLDLIVLEKADHFIGNCVSSFTSFAARARLMQGKPTSYWGYS
ncbi:hypothetical protein ScPMuIL_006344 [Solemya velum]